MSQVVIADFNIFKYSLLWQVNVYAAFAYR